MAPPSSWSESPLRLQEGLQTVDLGHFLWVLRSTLIDVAGNYRRFMGPNYRRGYMGRDYHVTGEHEAEAKAAERAKKPTRIGLFVLRLLGYKGRGHQPLPDIRRVSTSHMHPHRDPD